MHKHFSLRSDNINLKNNVEPWSKPNRNDRVFKGNNTSKIQNSCEEPHHHICIIWRRKSWATARKQNKQHYKPNKTKQQANKDHLIGRKHLYLWKCNLFSKIGEGRAYNWPSDRSFENANVQSGYRTVYTLLVINYELMELDKRSKKIDWNIYCCQKKELK